jgi:diguanylate cyclase (GGDEF)-like protein
MIFLTYEVFETRNGEPVTQLETYLDISISLISLLIALCIGLMASKLNKLSITDPLTNLFNRRYIENYQIGKKRPYVLFIDLDRFKFINDSLGHYFGDQILKAVSDRLKRQSDNRDIIARIGGDEFVIILNAVNVDNIDKKAKRILNELSNPYEIDGNDLFLTASIGISNRSENNELLNDLIVKADIAMYKAKLKGKNQYQFFMEEMNEEIMEITELEKGLHNAVKRKEFILEYQPKIDLKTNKIVGMEALVRWQHPSQGLMSPIKFIPLAEETGLIVPIGTWVMYTACLQNKAWQDAGFTPLRISVNISARQFQYHLVSTVKRVLNQTGLDPRWLELEITESMLMQNVEQAVQILRELKEIGVYLSIDDFGTGFSSLSYLKRFPIDTLKIDKSFVDDILSDTSIINAIVTLAHNLKMDVIAEGIENEQQSYALLLQQCDLGQGYLFSHPLTKHQFEDYILRLIFVS